MKIEIEKEYIDRLIELARKLKSFADKLTVSSDASHNREAANIHYLLGYISALEDKTLV